MFIVKARFRSKDVLEERMSEMRVWLDHNRFEPNTFRYMDSGPGMVCRVEFKIEAEANAFAKAFDGAIEKSPEMD